MDRRCPESYSVRKLNAAAFETLEELGTGTHAVVFRGKCFDPSISSNYGQLAAAQGHAKAQYI